LDHPDADDLYQGLDDNYELKKDNWSGGHQVVEQLFSRFHDRRLEKAYYNYVTDNLLNKIKRRLFYSGLAVLLGLIWTTQSPLFHYPLFYSLVPALLTWGTCAVLHTMDGAGGWWQGIIHDCWRDVMMAVIIGSYISIIFAEYSFESKIGKPEACPQCRLLWSYAWLLIMFTMTVMNSGLEHSLLHVMFVLFMLWLSFTIATEVRYTSIVQQQQDAESEGGTEGGVCMQYDKHRTLQTQIILQSLGVLIFCVYGARRVGRNIRKEYWTASLARHGIQRRQDIFDGKIELLAIFCNPSRVPGMSGRESLITPLKLMHELMFLLQAMPREHKEILPAASTDEAHDKIISNKARVIQFSGHESGGSGFNSGEYSEYSGFSSGEMGFLFFLVPLCAPRSALHALRSTLCAPRSALNSTQLHTLTFK
jgi:hypothetical protein